jgi:4-hydroxybenzoate polyprenyltransferase
MYSRTTDIDKRPPSLVRDLVAMARPDHWFKNIFMLPGLALALILSPDISIPAAVGSFALALLSTCLLSSANYTINEWLDATHDKHHPLKHSRPSAAGRVTARYAYAQYVVLAAAGLGVALLLPQTFIVIAIIFLAMGLIYNVPPIRTKDFAYIDVLSESLNNPLRLMLGWCAIVPSILPPSSSLIAYWMGGAFLMGVKRYAEFRFIADPEQAGRYRRSFRFYTERSLLLSCFFYALASAFFLGIFLIKYRIELLVSFPFLALLFVWYLRIGMRVNSVTQRPEQLYTEKKFVLFTIFLVILIGALFVIDMPWLEEWFVLHYVVLDP